MPGEQDTLRLFDLPSNKADLAELLGMVDQLDKKAQGFRGINIFGKTGNAGQARQDQQEMAAGLQQIAQLQSQLIELEKQLQAAKNTGRGSGKAQTDEEVRSLVAVGEARRQNIASIKDQIKYDNSEIDSLTRKRIELKQLKAEYANIGPVNQATEAGQKLLSTLQALNQEVVAQEAKMGVFSRNVGNYSGALKTLEEEFRKVSASMQQMESRAQQGVQNVGARSPMGFSTSQWKKENLTDFTTASGQMVSVLNEDAEAFAKLNQQAGYLNTIIQKNEQGFTSVTQQIRTNERALISLREAGLEGSEAFAQLREETVASAREMKEFQRQQKLLESELPALKALTLAAKGLGGAYAITAGAGALFAEGNEKVQKEAEKMIAIMTILQGVEEAWVLVNQAGAAAMALKATGMEIASAATEVYTFVTEGATAATIALNAALTASVIGAIVVALVGMIYLLTQATASEKELAEAQSKLNEQMKGYYESLVKSNESLEEELKKQDEIAKKQEQILEINARSIADQEHLSKLKHDINEEDKRRATEEMNDLKEKLGSNEELQGEYDEQIRRISRLKELSADYQKQITDAIISGKGHGVLDEQLENNDALIKSFQSQADSLKVKLDRFKEVNNQQEEAEQEAKRLNAEDEKFAHELYERKIKALTEINNLVREQSAEFLSLQQGAGGEKARVAAAEAELAIRKQIIDANMRQELRAEGLTGDERELIRQKAQDQLYKLDQEFIGKIAVLRYNARQEDINDENMTNAELLKLREQYYQRQAEQAQARFNNRKSAIDVDRDQRLKALEEERTKINPQDAKEIEKFNDRKLQLQTKFNNKALAAEMEYTRQQIELANQKENEIKGQTPGTPEGKQKQLKDIQDLEVQKNELTAKYANLDLQMEQNTANQKMKLEEEALARKRKNAQTEREITQQVAETTMAYVDASYEHQLMLIDRQIQKNNELKATEEARIQNSTMTETERAAAMERLQIQTEQRNQALQRKERQVKAEQAIADRDAAVLKIFANTMIDASEYGWITPTAILVEAIGAAQIAALMAKPIPKFETGTDFSPEGLAMVHPGEMRIDPSGKVSMTPDRPALTFLERGTKIIPKNRVDDMNEVLLASIFGGGGAPDDNRLYSEVRGLKDTILQVGRDQVAAIKKQKFPEPHIHINPDFMVYIKNCQ